MPDQRLFPPSLLQQSPSVRKEYFKNFLVKHDKIKVAADEILRLINDPADTEVIHVVGPSGGRQIDTDEVLDEETDGGHVSRT